MINERLISFHQVREVIKGKERRLVAVSSSGTEAHKSPAKSLNLKVLMVLFSFSLMTANVSPFQEAFDERERSIAS